MIIPCESRDLRRLLCAVILFVAWRMRFLWPPGECALNERQLCDGCFGLLVTNTSNVCGRFFIRSAHGLFYFRSVPVRSVGRCSYIGCTLALSCVFPGGGRPGHCLSLEDVAARSLSILCIVNGKIICRKSMQQSPRR